MYLTVAQTAIFQRQAVDVWAEPELDEFVSWIARNALEGDLIPQSGGLRKVRWNASGRGQARRCESDLLQPHGGRHGLAVDGLHKGEVR
jgi:hypothetical protein